MVDACKYGECAKPAFRVGFCVTHYRRQLRGKDMSLPIREYGNPQPLFWLKVHKTPDCWTWNGHKDKKGYGRWGKRLAHRLAYEFVRGPIPAGVLIDHECWNHACVNPDHLRLATNALNAQNRAPRASTSGVRGVYWDKPAKGWRAAATVNGWRPYLGTFATIAEAEAVVTAFRREHMPYSLMDQERKEA